MQPLEAGAVLLGRVALRHEVVFAAVIGGAARFDFLEDALTFVAVDHEQVALVGRHDGEVRGAEVIDGVAACADEEPHRRGELAFDCSHGGDDSTQREPQQAGVAQPGVALDEGLAVAADVRIGDRERAAARAVLDRVLHFILAEGVTDAVGMAVLQDFHGRPLTFLMCSRVQRGSEYSGHLRWPPLPSSSRTRLFAL